MGYPGRWATITAQSAAEGIEIDRGTAAPGEGVVGISEVMQAHQRIRPPETEADNEEDSIGGAHGVRCERAAVFGVSTADRMR